MEMSTLPLFATLARKGDPSTSREAAEAIVPHLSKLFRWINTLIRDTPGRTAAELARHYGQFDDTRRIGKRLAGLAKIGGIYRGDKRVCGVSGRMCLTWWPTDA